jgi:hypothetical protein
MDEETLVKVVLELFNATAQLQHIASTVESLVPARGFQFSVRCAISSMLCCHALSTLPERFAAWYVLIQPYNLQKAATFPFLKIFVQV